MDLCLNALGQRLKTSAEFHSEEAFATLAAEQEIAHVVAEGAADVATVVGQHARETATVEGTEGVSAVETWMEI